MFTQSKILLFFLLTLSLLGLSGCSQPAAQTTQVDPGLVFQDCQLSSAGITLRLAARCTSLKVFEDRAAGQGRQIDLHIAVIPAVSRNPAPDPLFFFAGGPGQSATDTFVILANAFERVNQERDIVLVDQRGTGKSNPLDCPVAEGEFEEGTPEETAAQVKACLDGLDADPSFYTTAVAMQDLDQARQALGYAQINLFGVSYGTRAALTYLQMFPDNVRSIVLDGVVPQDEPLGLEVAKDAQRALDLLFERCREETACSQAFPNLENEFNSLFAALKESPVEVDAANPVTGKVETLTLGDAELGTAVRLLSYAPETAALLPLIIHKAASEQDYSLLAAQYLMVAGDLTTSISEGMNYSVVCTEDLPFITAEAAAQADEGAYLGGAFYENIMEVCEIWPAGTLPEGFKEPVASDTPVLLLSGEADPVTPPENAEKVASTLPNSLSLVAEGQGHNIVFRGCIPDIVAEFIAAGSGAGIDTACIDAIQPMPFFVNLSGPVP